jgi:hypothetical protein
VATGRFGLRVTPSGIGTPPYGPDGDALRIAGDVVVRELREAGATRSATMPLAGSSLRQLAAFAGVDLASAFSAGSDTPELGDVDAPIELDLQRAADLLAWLHVGSVALDRVLPSASEPSVAQLWPEHFDLGIDVATGNGRVNLGASPGDAGHPEPYLYVSPWEGSRPGDPTFWNAPFGALKARGDGLATSGHVADAVTFFETGLDLLGRV